MKNIFLVTLFVFIFFNAQSQSLTGVIPGQGTAGTTLTAIITGQNTFFMSGSPQGVHSIYIGNYSAGNYTCLLITGTNFIIISDDSIQADFPIPAGIANGIYDIYLQTATNIDLNLFNSVTVTGGVNYSLQSISPTTAIEAQTFSPHISGQNLQSLQSAQNFAMSFRLSHNTYYPANVTAINADTLSCDLYVPTYTDTGNANLIITSSVGCFVLSGAVNFHAYYPKQLVSIQPSQGSAGGTLTAQITGQNVFFMSGSPQGIQTIRLENLNCNIINGTNPNVIDDDHFTADFNIPASASNGDYDLYVKTNTNHSYVLPIAFTVIGGVDRNFLSFSPSSANAGTIVNAIVTGNDLNNILNALPVTVVLVSSGGFQLTTSSMSATSTQAFMDFPIPIYADNGFYELRITSAIGCYKIAQAIQIQGGLPRGLTSITPSQGNRGQTLTALITSSYTFFMSGCPSNGVKKVHFSNSTNGGNQFNVVPPNITVIDSDHVSINFTIPFSVPSGFYDVSVETYGGTFYSLTPGFEITGTRISGNVYFDVDSNGVFSTGDVYLPGRKVQLLPDSTISFSGQNGEFNFAVDSGQYDIGIFTDTNWFVTSSPPSYTITVDSLDTLGLLFGVQPIIDEYQMYVTLTGSVPRCGWSVNYNLTYTNNSTIMVNGQVYFIPDSNLIVNSSVPPADFINGDTLFWNYDSLNVFHSKIININVHIPSTAGIHLVSFANVKAKDISGNVLASADDTLLQTVTCSFDPNDKSVDPEGVQAGHYVLNNQFLEYLIRFQNTGNDTAFEVMILDTLDSSLDPATLQVVASSHPVETHLHGNVVEFRFINILLPDSNANELQSHGFVKYRIMPYTGLIPGTLVNNQAGIYFDLNSPVITNTVFNTLVDNIPSSISKIIPSENNLLIYPNPSHDKVNIYFENPSSDIFQGRIFNINGSMMKIFTVNSSSIIIDIHLWNDGVYFILVEDLKKGLFYKGKIVIY